MCILHTSWKVVAMIRVYVTTDVITPAGPTNNQDIVTDGHVVNEELDKECQVSCSDIYMLLW